MNTLTSMMKTDRMGRLLRPDLSTFPLLAAVMIAAVGAGGEAHAIGFYAEVDSGCTTYPDPAPETPNPDLDDTCFPLIPREQASRSDAAYYVKYYFHLNDYTGKGEHLTSANVYYKPARDCQPQANDRVVEELDVEHPVVDEDSHTLTLRGHYDLLINDTINEKEEMERGDHVLIVEIDGLVIWARLVPFAEHQRDKNPPIYCPPIPTVSEWGVVILGLLLATFGKLYFGRRAARLRLLAE